MNRSTGFYQNLGVNTVINGWSWVTVVGGSLMPQPVMDSMLEASRNFVDMHELNQKAGEEIARITGAESGLVTAGSAAGMQLQAAACITGTDSAKISKLPDTRKLKNQIVIHRMHRVSYDRCFRGAGADLVEIGDSGNTEPWELEEAINKKTAAVAYIFGPRKSGDLSLETVVDIAHSHVVPVIVDAAAMLPPVENLTKYIELGADMVSFSGGKGIMGPQSSGVRCGRKDLIEAAYLNAAPNSQGIGRPAKVSKENIAGLITALQLFVDRDYVSVLDDWRNKCDYIVNQLKTIASIRVSLSEADPSLEDSKSNFPRVLIYFEKDWTGPDESEVISMLKNSDPPIYLGTAGPEGGIAVIPVNLQDGEEEIVASSIQKVIKRLVQ